MVMVSTSIAGRRVVGFSTVDVKAGGPVGRAGVSSTIGGESALSLQGTRRQGTVVTTSKTVLLDVQEHCNFPGMASDISTGGCMH